MTKRNCSIALAGLVLAAAGWSTITMAETPEASPADVTGATYRMEPAYLVAAHVPSDDADKVLASVVAAVGLEYGKYDHVAYLDAPGLEQYRPMAGSKAGEQAAPGRTTTTNISFSIPRDTRMLKKAIDAVYGAHTYEEPVIYVSEVWRSRSTSSDDTNPNRWWNKKQ